MSSSENVSARETQGGRAVHVAVHHAGADRLANDPAVQALIVKGYVPARQLTGKVVGLWGVAFVRDAEGHIQPLKVGDVVKKGEVVLTGQDGIVQVEAARHATIADLERVIAEVDQGAPDAAPAAGLQGADGGDLQPGLRVDRISETVTPAGIGTEPISGQTITARSDETAPDTSAANIASPDSATVTEDGSVNIDPRGNDMFSGAGTPAVQTVAGQPIAVGQPVVLPQGAVTLNPNGTLTFTPAPDFNGSVTIPYSADDGSGAPASSTIVVTVTPVNDGPVAAGDLTTTTEDTPVVLDPRGNDTDADGDPLAITEINGHPIDAQTPVSVTDDRGLPIGTVSLNPDGSLTFTPAPDYHGPADFNYTVSDGHGGSATGHVGLSVTPVADAPTVVADSASTAENTPVVIDVLANDSIRDGDALTITEVNGQPISAGTPVHLVDGNGLPLGDVRLTADGRLEFTPAPGTSGPVDFHYTATDGRAPVQANVHVEVSPVNDAPVARDNTVAGAEDLPLTFDPRSNDTDADGDALSITAINGQAVSAGHPVTLPEGQLSLNADGTLTFLPAPNYHGTLSFDYTVSDGHGGSATAQATLVIQPVDDQPSAGNDSFSATEDTPLSGSLGGNDSLSADGGNTFALGTGAAHGTVVVNVDGTFTYTPAANYNGADSFTYTVTDVDGDVSTATVTLNVASVNDLPTAKADTFSATEDTLLNGSVAGNDTLSGDGRNTFALGTGAAHGTVVVNADGTFTYTPTASYNGPDSFTYTLTDADGDVSTATVTLNVASVDDLPVAKADAFNATEDTVLNGSVAGNDTLSGDGGNTFALGTGAAHGTVVVNADGTFTYTPTVNYNGPDSFTYTLTDADGDASTATVTLNVASIDDLPTAKNDTFAATEDTVLNGSVAGNDTLSGDGSNTFALGTGAAHGTVVVNADGTFTYTPAANYNGPDSFTYTLTDADGDVSTTTVTLNVASVDDLPTAKNDTFSATEDTVLNGSVAGNDTLSGDGSNTFSLGTNAAHGTVVVNADGTFTYTPTANYNGPDSFTYTLTDADGDVSTATVTLNVASVDDLPTAKADTFNTTEDTVFNGSVAGNDTLSGDGGNTFALGTNAAHGTVIVNADGTFTYTPAANYNGPDSFTYTLTDADGDVSNATVTLNIASVDDLPTAKNDTFAATEDTVLNGSVAGNDTLSGDGGNTFALGTGAAHGTVVVNADGTFTYTPAANYNGPDSFTYTLTDGDGDVSTATVTLNVASVDDLPTAKSDTFAAAEDTVLNGSVAGNDTLSGDGGNTFALGTGAAHGTVVINADGTFTYTPAANYNGADSFTYTLTDADGDVSTATVTLNVASVDDLPAAKADTFNATEDNVLNGSVAGNDTLSGDGGNAFALGTNAAHGTVIVNADGTFTYTPVANYNGPDSFTYTLTDADGDVSTATVTLNVASVDDLPTAKNDTFAATEDIVLNGSVAGNDTLSGDGGNAFALGTGAAHGTVVVNADGTFTYTPAANYNGPDSFTYTLTDADGDVSTATVTLNVASVDDLPTAKDDTFSATEDTVLNGSVAGNDKLSGDGGNAFALGTGAAHGVVVVNADGTFTYTPAANYNGPDSFTYTLTDADGEASTAIVTLNVASIDDLPTAKNDTFAATEDTVLNGSVAGNDTLSGDGGNAFALGTNAAHGTVIVNADGTFTYTPAGNYNGPDSFTYTLTDVDGDVSTATVTLNVASVDDLPTAKNDTFAATEDTVLNGSVAANDTLSGDGGNAFALGTNAAHGTVVVNADGTFTYTPAANYNGPDSFTYTLTDADGDVSTATVTLNVASVNDLPTAKNDTFAATEDTVLNGSVAGNDTLSGDGGNTFALGTNAAHGTVVVNADGTFTYTPAANYNGPDSFTYALTDADGDVSTATVTLNVVSVDDLPAAKNDTFSATEDTVLNGSVAGNDTLSGDGGNTFALGTGTAHGTVVINADGTFAYTPASNYNGPDSFTYTLTDADGDVSTATVTLNVTSVDDLPVAKADTFAATEDAVLNGSVAGNDSLSGDGGNAFAIGTNAAHGIAVVNADGTFTYTPTANYNGPDSFTYTLTDADGDVSTATVTLNVASVDDLPTAKNDTFSATEDTVLNGSVAGNDTLSGDGSNTFALGTNAAHGTVVVNADGTFTYTPAANYNGADSFTYTLTDADGDVSTATVTLNVASIDDLPTAKNDTFAATEDTVLNGSVAGNDTLSGDGGNTFALGTGAAHGTVTVNADGTFTYTPAANYNGPDSFSYALTDADGDVSTATVTLNVASVDDLPTAKNDTFSATEDTVLNGSVAGNDTLSGDGGNTFALGTGAAHGTVVINADGTFTYTPAANYNGADSFTYTLTDADGDVSTATVTLNVASVDDLPAAKADTFNATEDNVLNGSVAGNDTLSGDGGNTFALGTGAAHGAVVVNADGTFTYTPAANYNGPDSFTYTLTDADGDVSTATVTLNVASVDDLPTAENDTFAATEDAVLNGSVAGNDTLSGDGGNVFAIGTGAAHGAVIVNADGTFTYTPAANYNGPDSFTYTLTDADGDVSTATVTLNVASVDNLPVAKADTFAATEDTVLNGSVAGNDTLSGDGGNVFALGTGAAHGTVVVNADGTFTYTPAANYNGPDSFTYTLTDADGDVSTATVTMNVASVDDLPTAKNDTFSATEDTVLNGTVAGNDTLSGDGGNAFALGANAAHGTVVVNADGTFTYTPTANYNGPDSFTYTLTDADGDVSSATVTLNVSADNDSPGAANDTFAAIEDTVLNGSIAGNDTLSGDGGNSFALGTGAAHGTVVVNADGTFTYTPAANYNGPDSFTYTLTDADGDVSTATVTLNVASVDDLPTAKADTFAANEDTTLNGSVAGNDTLSGDGGNTFALGTGAAHGTVVVNADGTFTYTPAANYNGPDSFTYTLTDADGDVSTATVMLNVASVDDVPTTKNDTFAATEDTVLNGSVAGNDTLSGDGGNVFSLGTGAAHGTVVVNADGTFAYTPAANYNGPDSFTYTLIDADGDVSTATVTLNVASVDDLPTAKADALNATEDTVLNGSVAGNDTLSGDGGNVFAIGTGAAHGTAVVNSDGTFTYTPAVDYNGPDSFTYTLTDADGDVSTATVTLNVASVDDLPTAKNDTFAAAEDTVLNGSIGGNDTLSGDGGNVFAIGTGAAHGTVVVNADGTFTYTPAANYNGPDSFTYSLTDADGDVSMATVTLNVASVDDLPTAKADTFNATEDTVLNGSVAGNDTLSGDGGNAFALGTNAAHGAVVVNADGTFTYTLAANYNGPDSFTYTLTDADGDVSTATVTLNVGSVDDLPTAKNDTFAATEDTVLNGSVAGNDTLSGDGGNVFSLGTGAAHGTVVVNADGTFTYTPAANYNGPDSFTYTLTDADGDVSTATVTLNIASVDDLPVAKNDTFAATEDTVLNGSVAGNDTLSGDGGNVFAIGTGAAHGTVVVNADGTFTYTPAANYNGTDSFTYTLTDADGDVSTATVTLNVGAVDDLPVAKADTFAATEDTVLNGSVAGNDTLSGDGGNVFSLDTGAAHGTVVVNADGTFTYTPAANYNGPDSFTYTLTDADGDVSTATVTLNVASVVDLPTAKNDTFAATEDTVLKGSVAGNDTLSGDGGNTFALGTGAAHGTVVVNANGTFTYTPAANHNGPDSFTYTLTDADGDVSTATVTLNVASVDDLPTAKNDTFAATEDTVLNGNVAANDTLSGDGGNVFTLGTNAAHGTVVVNADGTFTYTPAANYNGPDSFTYTLTDADGDVSTATVTLNVASVDDLPVAKADTFVATEDTVLNGNVAANDTLSGDGGNAFALGTNAAHGTVIVNADGTFTYTPAANYNGPDSFTYTLTDADGDVSTATVNLNVAAVDDPSVLTPDSKIVAEDTAATGDVLSNDSDVDSSLTVTTFTVAGVASSFNAGQTANIAGVGTFAVAANGNYTFTPVANWNGAVPQLTYNTNTGSSSTLNVTVTAVDDASVLAADTKTVAEDTAATGNVLSNDTDIDSALTVASFTVTGVAGTFNAGQTATIAGVGTLALNANGDYTFTPVADWNGAVPQVTYTTNTGSSSTLNVTVTSVNDAPASAGGAVIGTEDANLVFSWAQFNVSDVDSATSSLGVQITTLPTDGTLQFFNGSSWVAVTLNQTITQAAIAAGNLRFVPDANESGADAFNSAGTGNLKNDYAQFNFKPTDGGTTGSTASMRIDINPVADAPTLTTKNHDVTLVTTSFEAADTGLTQSQLNPNTTSTSTLTQTTLGGWTRVDTPDAYAGGTNVWELWSNGDTMANQANTQIGVAAGTGNGQNWLELNNADNNGALVQTLGLSRSVTTTAGYVYDLSFDYAGRLGFSQDFTKITVLVDGVKVASYAGTSGQNALNWENLHFSFVGNGGAQTVTIITDAAQFNTNGRGAMIDDIKLTESQGAQAGNAGGGSKTEIALSGYITSALTDADNSESLSLTIGGLPANATVVTASHPSGYTVVNGAVTIPASELASAKLQLSSSYLGNVALTVTSTTTEPNGSTASTNASLNFKIVVGAGDVGTEGSTHMLMSSTAAVSATGLHGEYFGYNETANQGQFYNVQTGDGTVGNLDSIADITSIINLRQGSSIVGTSASASNAAMDASFNASNLSYGQSVAVTNSLGSNSPTAVGNSITTGSLYNFLGAANAGNNTGTLKATSSFGQTTDAIVRMVGSAYFSAGTYDFQVRADDGYSIRIDGQVVMQYDANQAATTRATTTPVAIGEGPHTVEIVYWEQGTNAELLVQYKPSGAATYQTLSLDNLALFQTENAPTLTELQDIIENPSVNGQYLIRTGQEAYGGTGADSITGSDGRDVIHGGAGSDSINGGGAADRIEGGAGNDTLTGGLGADTFRWELADHGSNGTPAIDTITDFDTRGYTSGGDRLDLRDLLVGESQAGGNLGSFISFEKVGSNTVVHISSSGGFGGGYTASAEDQTIVLQNVDLTNGFTTNAQIIQDLLDKGKIVTD
ncbi:Ig-like domain-containing protein [Ideonella sp.]|uniref:Ig-like domain-containing protein n=1 Tax=Ideonella sp. TaxID=1929293 RepID=UPI0035B0FF7F